MSIAAALCVAFWLRSQAPPEPARLLPESDAIVYAQLSTLRAATHFDSTPVARSAEFQHFIDATGFVPERDLDAAAFALHRMADPRGPNGAVAYSEVLSGKFDGVKVARYLESIATSKETYAGKVIYSIPVEGRVLRVTQMGYDTIAASNMPTPEQIHSMLDRHAAPGLWQPGSSLLAARYREVPVLSQAWAIGHIGLPFAEHGKIAVLGMELPLAEDTDLVASLRYTGSVHLRVEEIAPDTETAAHTVQTLGGLLNFLRALEDAQPANTPAAKAMRAVVDSMELSSHKDRAVLSATASADEIRAMASSSGASASK